MAATIDRLSLREVALDAVELASWHNLMWGEWAPGWPELPAEQYAAWQSAWFGLRVRRMWIVEHGGMSIGTAMTSHGRRADSEGHADVNVFIDPSQRRFGAARWVSERLAELLVAADRRQVHCSAPVASGSADAMLAIGAQPTGVIQLNRLRIADAIVTGAALADGFQIVAWDSRCPDELIGSFADATNSMNDAPNVGGTAPRITEVQDIRWGEEHRPAGVVHWRVAAVDSATGVVAAYTELTVVDGVPMAARQGDTVVVGRFRGHGLGLTLKEHTLRRLLAERPECVYIDTWNAADNRHMLAINHRLGFRLAREFQLASLTV